MVEKEEIIDFNVNTLFNVKNKIALVTGGGSGIGKMITSALVQNGAKVYIASRNLKVIEQVAKELTDIGPGKCIAIQASLSSKEDAIKLAKDFESKEDRLDVLVNNSGMSWGSPYNDFDEKNGWDNLMALNVKIPFYLTSALTPLLSKSSKGNIDPSRVINISSILGSSGNAEGGLSAKGSGIWSYAASKAALNQVTRTLVLTLAPHNITINAIAPGIFPSRMTKFGIDKHSELFNKSQPLGRIGTPEDMAGLALFLCSRASSHISGAIIPIDGGQNVFSSKL